MQNGFVLYKAIQIRYLVVQEDGLLPLAQGVEEVVVVEVGKAETEEVTAAKIPAAAGEVDLAQLRLSFWRYVMVSPILVTPATARTVKMIMLLTLFLISVRIM